MDAQRRRFLADLSARLGNDRAVRESEVATPPKWFRGAEQSDAARPPSPFEAPALPDLAAVVEPDDRPTPAEVVPPLRRPARRRPTSEALESREPDQVHAAAVPWSETGMPQALRDAIASVRRVSHQQLDQLAPRSAQALDEQTAFDDGETDEQPQFGNRARHEEPPFDDAADESLPFDEQAPYEQTPFGEAEADEPPFRYRALHEPPSFESYAAGERLPFDATDELAPFGDDGTDDHRGLGLWEGSQDQPPLRREPTDQRGLTFAAFAFATAFVLLAGVGLGVLSKGQGLDRLMATLGWPAPANETATTAASGSASASTRDVARPAEPGAPPQPSELVTVRVAPLPATPVTGQSPAPATNGLPLPPPPKPAIRSSLTGDGPRTTDPLASALDDAAAALLEADAAGGSFEPIFVKTPGSAPRVFVHYTESAVGAPATALHLVLLLKGAGFAAEARPVAFPIPTHSVRYFFDADRDEAEALSASLQGQIPGATTVPVMDFTHYEPRPRPGLLEVWFRA